jgi:hypothetical protein
MNVFFKLKKKYKGKDTRVKIQGFGKSTRAGTMVLAFLPHGRRW